jgi:hypothetical protein
VGDRRRPCCQKDVPWRAEAPADRFNPVVVAALGSRFGGMWLRQEAQKTVVDVGVALLTSTDSATIAAAARGIVDFPYLVNAVSVPYSNLQLDEFDKTLNSALAEGSVTNGESVGLAIRSDLGKIIATLPPDSPDAQAELAALIPVDAIAFEEGSGGGHVCR